MWRDFSSAARSRRGVLREQLTHPRTSRGDNWGGQLRLGYFIDWVDSRPSDRELDLEALSWLADRDEAARASAILGAWFDCTREQVFFTPHNDHTVEYGPSYHAGIAGHLDEEELPDAREVWQRLLAADTTCLSALVNLAECARRSGDISGAKRLLSTALSHASSRKIQRHGVLDSDWKIHVECALARLGVGGEAGAPELRRLSAGRDLAALVNALRSYGNWASAAVPAHRALAEADSSSRVLLLAAMRAAPISPRPPPSSFGSERELDEAESLVLTWSQSAQ